MSEAATRGRRHAFGFALAALVLYVPANVLPILQHASFGRRRELTIWEGVVELVGEGDLVLAGIVFVASIAVPLLKIFGVLGVAWLSGRDTPDHAERLRRAHRFLELIGPWSMLDVFLLAIAISIVRFGDITFVAPRAGIYAFAAVVVLTIVATQLLGGAVGAKERSP